MKYHHPNRHLENAPLTAPRLVSRRDLKSRGIDYSNVHLLRLEAEGKFPKRLYLSPAHASHGWRMKSMITSTAASQPAVSFIWF
jgi:hypothetical protein